MALHGHHMREGIGMADTVAKDVQRDLMGLAEEMRVKVLDGDERKGFLKSMTQDEFDILHRMAVSMGPKGLNALERIIRELGEGGDS